MENCSKKRYENKNEDKFDFIISLIHRKANQGCEFIKKHSLSYI